MCWYKPEFLLLLRIVCNFQSNRDILRRIDSVFSVFSVVFGGFYFELTFVYF
jgi:hypothetical protein